MHELTILYTGTRAPDPAPEGVRVVHRPLLEARPIDFDRGAALALLHAAPSAIVFYSRHAVRTVCEAGIFDGLFPGTPPADYAPTGSGRHRHQFFAVGQNTADLLEELLGVRVTIPAAENFEGLSAMLDRRTLPPQVIAFALEGQFRDLRPVCVSKGVAFYNIPVYETVGCDPDMLAGELETLAPDWIAFASPRGVEAFADVVSTMPPAHTRRLWSARLAAIGPSTAAALVDTGYPAELVLETPDRNLMIETIVRTDYQTRTR